MARSKKPDGNPALGAELVRIQRERVHTSMLIELLVLLVFLAMAFAFVKGNEQRLDTVQEELEEQRMLLAEAREKIGRLERENERLLEENGSLERSLRRFMSTHEGTLLPNERYVLVRQQEFSAQIARSVDAETIIEDQQEELAQLQSRLEAEGRGGSDRPRCRVASGDYIVRIDMLASGGYIVYPNWPKDAATAVANVPGLVKLASSRSLSEAEFSNLANQMDQWGRSQPIECGFYAVATLKHSSLTTYRRQQQVIGRYFYAAWR